MEESFEKTPLSKAIFAAFFSGYVAVCISIAFDIIYRGITHYDPSFIINIPSIIFGLLIVSLFSGGIYFFLTNYVKGGKIVYILLFLILWALLANVILNSNYGDTPAQISGFKGLSLGITSILGVAIVVGIPYFYNHDKIFAD